MTQELRFKGLDNQQELGGGGEGSAAAHRHFMQSEQHARKHSCVRWCEGHWRAHWCS